LSQVAARLTGSSHCTRIAPASPKSLPILLATLAPPDEDFPPIPDPAADPVEL
jgi:hypothetical protein